MKNTKEIKGFKDIRDLKSIRSYKGTSSDMDSKIHKERFALTMLFSAWFSIVFLIATCIEAVTLFMLAENGILEGYGLSDDIGGALFRFIVLISVPIGIVMTALASKYITRPVNSIINQINRLASGDFKARLSFKKPISYHPTITELTTSFNTMAQELENTELLRNDFIHNFSHEFKTPIVSIAGFAELLEEVDLPEETRKKYISIIREESVRLATMATNVLNMTKVENMTILQNTAQYNVSEQIRNCILMLERKWSAKNIEFKIDFDEFDICANAEMMKQVWINLIDNAIKFSSENSVIEILIESANNGIHISVMNAGEEIPMEKREKIFNKFYQADESHTTEGNGIGLALVDKIVRLHNGRVMVNCLDGITAFTVSLPK